MKLIEIDRYVQLQLHKLINLLSNSLQWLAASVPVGPSQSTVVLFLFPGIACMFVRIDSGGHSFESINHSPFAHGPTSSR